MAPKSAKKGKAPAAAAAAAAAAPPKEVVGSIAGFVALPVFTTAAENCVHYLYLRKHDSSAGAGKGDLPEQRTLFVTNLPPVTSEAALRRILEADLGAIESVKFFSLRKATSIAEPIVDGLVVDRKLHPELVHVHGPGAAAYVVFASEVALNKLSVLPVRERSLVAATTSPVPVFGLEYYLRQYELRRPKDTKAVDAKVNKFMATFEKTEHELKSKLDKHKILPDDDGFVTVTRRTKHGRTGSEATGMATATTAASAKRAAAAKKKKNELLDFYRFQMRQSKREDIAELRRKFEEDKAKIEKMKALRKFRPY